MSVATEYSNPSVALATASVARASHALEQAGESDGQEGRTAHHDLRACLGTLVAALQVLDCVAPDSELAGEARRIVQRHVARIDLMLDLPPWKAG